MSAWSHGGQCLPTHKSLPENEAKLKKAWKKGGGCQETERDLMASVKPLDRSSSHFLFLKSGPRNVISMKCVRYNRGNSE